MKQKQNKTSFGLLSGVMAFCLLAILGWTFRDDFSSKLDSKPAKVGIEDTNATKPRPPRVISYEDRIKKGRELINYEYFSKASVELSKAIKRKPEEATPYILLGEIYLRTNDQPKLEALLEKLKTSFPQHPSIRSLQVRQLINQRLLAETSAILSTEESLPSDLTFYKAILFSLQNNHEGAQELLRSLQKIPVKTIEEISALEGEALNEAFITPEFDKKVKDILVIYEEFEELKEGKNAHLFAQFSKALAENHEPVLALEFADTAIKEDIGYIDAWILRGYAQLTTKDYEAALKDFRHAYELDPIRPEVHYFLALALFEQGNLDEAALFFEKSLEYQFEFSEEVRWKLIDIFAAQQKFDRVLELYKDLLKYSDDTEKFASAVHTAIDLVNKPEVALEFTELLLENNPKDILTLNIHAWALIANKDFLEAQQTLKKADKIDKDNPRTLLNWGLYHEEKQNFEKAKSRYQASYEAGKDQPQYGAIINLAAEKYNQLLNQEEQPEVPAAPDRPASSP